MFQELLETIRNRVTLREDDYWDSYIKRQGERPQPEVRSKDTLHDALWNVWQGIGADAEEAVKHSEGDRDEMKAEILVDIFRDHHDGFKALSEEDKKKWDTMSYKDRLGKAIKVVW